MGGDVLIWKSIRGASLRDKLVVAATITIFLAGVVLMVVSDSLADEGTWKPILQSMGSFTAVTVGLGFLYKTTIRAHDERSLEKKLISALDKKFDKAFVGCTTYGIEGFVDDISFPDIFDSLVEGQTLWWLDTYDPNHHGWHENLDKALERGVNAKFLVLDPQSPLTAMRAEELGPMYAGNAFKAALEAFLERLRVCLGHAQNRKGSLEVVKYEDLPCAPIYVVEEGGVPIRAYSSLFLGKATAVRFPHLQWRNSNGGYINEMFDYLKDKWERNLAGKLVADPNQPLALGEQEG